MMALCDYKFEEENVRNLVRKEKVIGRQVLKYKSKFAENVKKEYQKSKKHHQTMGYAQVPLKSPKEYLKKRTGLRVIKLNFDHFCLGRHSPRRMHPGAQDKDPCTNTKNQTHKETNFVRNNFLRKLEPPVRKERRIVDAYDGHIQGDLHPVYVFRKNFGKTPKYILKRKHEWTQQAQQNQRSEAQEIPFYKVSQEERLEILQGLKNYWTELNKEFQVLPLKIDTEPLKKRKFNLESKLKQLEKDIELIQKHDLIYVTNDSEDGIDKRL